ncbi:hypothetical protein PIB30_078500 [Stylosanthes scabra]|uniref:Uncharacterized protein n=1 Tax=Stylosanthes scabra TaxID=79078 RepID=A0ABU6UTA2_9FABA|nr:hypothetical protein [Stylosanthes scabra]
MDGGTTSAMNLATMPISGLTQVMLNTTKGGPSMELRFQIESQSVNLIEVSVEDESARNNGPGRKEEVSIDKSSDSGSNKLKACAERTHSHAIKTTIAVEALFQGIEVQFSIIGVKFEELNRDLFEKCKEIVHKCIDDAKREKTGIHAVVLLVLLHVMGSTNLDSDNNPPVASPHKMLHICGIDDAKRRKGEYMMRSMLIKLLLMVLAAMQATLLRESYSIVPNMVDASQRPIQNPLIFQNMNSLQIVPNQL